MHSFPRKAESSRGQRAGAAHRPCVHLGTCPQVSCEPGRRLTNLMLPTVPQPGTCVLALGFLKTQPTGKMSGWWGAGQVWPAAFNPSAMGLRLTLCNAGDFFFFKMDLFNLLFGCGGSLLLHTGFL